MIFLSIIIIAGYSLTRLGTDMLPTIERPAVTVISSYPGASPEDVETRVTEPLENQLATTPGLEKITSRSREGSSIITLLFKWGTNLDEASNDIRDRIDLSKRYLPTIPDEMENPFIFKFNTANMPILFMGITAEQSYPELYDIIDKRVGDSIKQLAGVGTVQIVGGLERQINIWIDRDRLEGYGISISDIKDRLKKENVTLPVGSIESGLTDYLLRLPGEFTSPDDINHVILGQRDGRFIFLRDVAGIEDSFKEVTMNVRINRRPGILMMVLKQTGTNTVEVAERVKKRLSELKKDLPPDVEMYVIFDTSRDIITAVNSLKQTLWLGIMLVILVVWFFLRRFLPSVIIALTIPFSLLIAFVYQFLSGKTINIISLSSLAIASGMVVDNAIVVVDNIHRHLESGKRPAEAATFGASEMFLAIAASTLTTIVVFLPMLFIPGVIGIMFGELAIIVVVTLAASLFTSVTFTPMLCSKWLRIMKMGTAPIFLVSDDIKKNRRCPHFHFPHFPFERFYKISEDWFNKWEEFYSRALAWSLGHKKIVIYGFLGAFIASLFLKGFVGNEFIPEEDSGDVRININLPLGTRLEETDKVAERIEEIYEKEVPEAKYIFTRSGDPPGTGRVMAGASGKHVVVSGVKLAPKTERRRSVTDVAQAVRKKIQLIPGVMKTDVSTGNPLGRIITGMGGKAIQIDIIGHSFEETDKLAAQIKEIVEKTPGAVDVTISRDTSLPELKIEVDREKASALGLDMNTIALSIKTFIEGSVATRYRERGESYDIFVRLEEGFRSKPEDIKNLSFNRIKLSDIANIYDVVGPVQIERQNRERIVTVECNTYKRSPGKVREDIEKGLRKVALPPDTTVSFGGEAEEQVKAFRDLALLLLLGIILVYMVMAAQFESLLDPFIIMFAVPFTFTGVILGFILTKTTLSAITFLGMVMLMGIVVNNAIVLISYINILRARGLSMLEAVTTGGKSRLRPVLMTTITTLAGLLPLAISRGEGSEVWQPLGITMIGGLTVSTMITMIFVPTLYAVFESHLKIGK